MPCFTNDFILIETHIVQIKQIEYYMFDKFRKL